MQCAHVSFSRLFIFVRDLAGGRSVEDNSAESPQWKRPPGMQRALDFSPPPRNTIINDQATDVEAFVAFRVFGEETRCTVFSATTDPENIPLLVDSGSNCHVTPWEGRSDESQGTEPERYVWVTRGG